MSVTVGILFGGVSSEHDVSLVSASSVLRNLPQRYTPVMIGIARDGRWYHYTGPIDAIEEGRWLQDDSLLTPAVLSPDRTHHGLLLLAEGGHSVLCLDAVFPVLHGKNGEDGTMQGLCELAGIPYVGCDTLASAMCMDKAVTHTILDAAGIATAKFQAVFKGELARFDALEEELEQKLHYPMFVKPANAGSSVGVSKAKNKDDLYKALLLAFEHDRKAVVEEAIVGQEVECAVLGNDQPIASVVGEIAPQHEFYDYEGKYLDHSTDLYIPARIPDEVAQRVRETAVRAYKALGCTGLARVDFFARADGSILLNEPNTIPGFTSISMYPKLFEAAGIPYSELIDRLLTLAAERMNG